jgi:outer membrane protein assembly factor BamB
MAATRLGNAGRSRVVLCTVDGHVHAVTGKGGDPIWTATIGGAVAFAPALGALDDDAIEDVVVVTSDGHLHALSGQTGHSLWKVTSLKGPLLSGPVVADVTGDGRPEVVISARDGHVHVISAQGVELVRFASESENGQADFRAAPVLHDLNGDGTPEIVVGGVDGYVYAWSALNDDWHWRSQVGGAVLKGVLVANVDGEAGVEVLARDEHGQLVVLSGSDGSRIHAHPARGSESSEPESAAVAWLVHDVDADGRVEVVTGHHDGYVRCVDPATGKREWEVRHSAGQSAGLALLGSSDKQGVRLAVAPRGGRSLLVVSGRNGEVLEMHPVPGGITADPAAHDLDGDGTPEVLVATGSGTVLALTPCGAPRVAPVRISEASRRMQDDIVVTLVRAMDRPAPGDLVTLALSLSRLERHDEALEAIVRAGNQGHRSPRLGALRLLYGLRTGLGLDWNVLAACVRSGPERFLQAITECLHLLESSRPGKFHGALIPLVSRINRPGARDLLAREAIRLLMGGRPERDQRGVFSEDPVGADLFTAFSAFAAIAEGTVEKGEAQLAKVKTRTGQRFVSTWRALSDEARERLRVFRSTR